MSDDPANSGKMTYYVMAETDVMLESKCGHPYAVLLHISKTCAVFFMFQAVNYKVLLPSLSLAPKFSSVANHSFWLLNFFDLLCDSGGHCELLLLQRSSIVSPSHRPSMIIVYDTFCMLLS